MSFKKTFVLFKWRGSLWLLMCIIVLTHCQTAKENLALCARTPEAEISAADVLTTATPLTESSQAVAALAFEPSSQNLAIAYRNSDPSKNGTVVKLSVSDNQVLFTRETEPLHPTLTRLSQDAKILVSAIPKRVRAWDTMSGEGVFEHPREAAPPNDLQLSKDGRWLVEGDPGGFGTYSLVNRDTTGSAHSELGSMAEGGTAALNANGALIAQGEKRTRQSEITGRIEIVTSDGKINRPRFRLLFGLIPFSDSVILLDRVPIRLTFDDSSKWLAALTEDSIDLYSVETLDREGRQELAQGTFGALAFDSPSKMLAVGYSQGLRVYTVPELKQILDKPGAQVTSVAFSPDGCVLAWGDVEGTVHIINAPKP